MKKRALLRQDQATCIVTSSATGSTGDTAKAGPRVQRSHLPTPPPPPQGTGATSPPTPPLQLLLLDPLLVPREHAGERRHQGRGMAWASAQPAPEATKEDATRALRVEAAVELRDLLRPPHAQARHEAALIGQQGEQAPAPRPRAPGRRRAHQQPGSQADRRPPGEHAARTPRRAQVLSEPRRVPGRERGLAQGVKGTSPGGRRRPPAEPP